VAAADGLHGSGTPVSMPDGWIGGLNGWRAISGLVTPPSWTQDKESLFSVVVGGSRDALVNPGDLPFYASSGIADDRGQTPQSPW